MARFGGFACTSGVETVTEAVAEVGSATGGTSGTVAAPTDGSSSIWLTVMGSGVPPHANRVPRRRASVPVWLGDWVFGEVVACLDLGLEGLCILSSLSFVDICGKSSALGQ